MNAHDHIQRIEETAIQIASETRQINTLREEIALIEAKTTLGVQSETNENGKPAYSNEEARKAAQTIRLADDEGHRQLTARLRDEEERRSELIARHERLRSELKLFILDRQEEIGRAKMDDLPPGFPYK